MKKILVIGSKGQIGTELTAALRQYHGNSQVIAADLDMKDSELGEFNVRLNVLDKVALQALVINRKVTDVYHLAAILSAMGEKYPIRTWDVNMQGLLNVLEVAKTDRLKVFWPSSIAIFGKNAPKAGCPQFTVTEPETIYGISKLAGEQWCHYYFQQYGVDVRSLRYPGLISYSSKPGGGTTDYAVDIFHQAVQQGHYTSYLNPATQLPMMYMPDAIRATVQLMEAPEEIIRIRTSYNLSAMQFTPQQLGYEISKYLPGFKLFYKTDQRQSIADSWPGSIDDSSARKDWGWRPKYDLQEMTKEMIQHLMRPAT